MGDRKVHWESVYASKLPTEVSWYQQAPRTSLQLIRNAGIAADDALIDVGAGASSLVDCLLDEGYRRIAALDVSSRAIGHVRQRLGERATRVEWFVEDVIHFRPPHPFTLWHDRAVFHFLTDQADRRAYVAVMKKALRHGGHLIIGAFAVGGPTRCSGLDIVQYDARKLMAELGDGFELQEERTETHVTPAQKEQRFAWFRLAARGGWPATGD
jgi:SAM-dependent methyltransferase